MTNFRVKRLLVPIFINGECVYKSPSVDKIKEKCKEELDSMWDEVLRFENPHNYYVDLSEKLWNEKHELLKRRYS